MFGYVKAYKPELRVSEYDTYKAVYCTLCKYLGREYGIVAKMTLSYDYTFFALLRLGIQDECCGYAERRCSFNPLKRCYKLAQHSEQMSYTAACSILLFYYKLKDSLQDSGFFSRLKALLVYPFFALYRKKARRRYPTVDALAATMMQQQNALEADHCSSLDAAAEPTAKLLAALSAREGDDEISARVLNRLGYCLGKWIYLIDAVDDLTDDLKSGDYNPIAEKYNLSAGDSEQKITAAKQAAQALLHASDAGVAEAFELLELKRYKSIIGNVIYLGMPNTIKMIDRGKDRKTDERSL